MKLYEVTLHCAGYYTRTVSAENEKEAVDKVESVFNFDDCIFEVDDNDTEVVELEDE